MNHRYIFPILLTSLFITNSSGVVLIYWTHEIKVGDSFDMVLVDLKLNGPNGTSVHFPGTNYSATPDDIGLIVSNEIIKIPSPLYDQKLTNRYDHVRLNQSSPNQNINFERHVESALSYRPSFVETWFLTDTPTLRPSFVIYNDWNWQKNQVTQNWNPYRATVLNMAWTETTDIFTISYEVDLVNRFDHIQEKHVEKVEEAYFKNTGTMVYFNLFVDIIQNEEPLQSEILIANTQCDIYECESRRGFLESSLNNTKSDSENNQFLPSISLDVPTEVVIAVILSISLGLGVLILSKKQQ